MGERTGLTADGLAGIFSRVNFYMSDDESENGHYCVASFLSADILSEMADLFCFDQFHEFSELDNRGSVMLDDNGCPFESVLDMKDTLFSVFSEAIDEGLTSREKLNSQVVVCPYGVPRDILK